MNTLGQWLTEQVLKEQKEITKVIAIFPGRFQPMGRHHAKAFKWVQGQGFDEAWVATSGKVEIPKSPFSFKEKEKIIKSYGIGNVKQVKNPYKAEEILSKYPEETTAAVFVVGDKDAKRLGGKFFRPWKGKAEVGYRDGAYTLAAPDSELNVPGYGEMSGTNIRKSLGQPLPKEKDFKDKAGKVDKARYEKALAVATKEKQKLFKGIFGHTKNYDMVVKKLLKLNEIMEDFISKIDLKKIIAEVSNTAGPAAGMVDDGPTTVFTSFKGYESKGNFFANQLGWKVVDYILSNAPENKIKPDREVHSVTYFPAGEAGALTPINRDDLKGSKAWKKYVKRITQVALRMGYEFVNFLGAEASEHESKKEPNKPDKAMKKIEKLIDKQRKKVNEQALTKEWWSGIMEDITIPVNIGDTVLMGKFKNKKVVVKTIDWNEKGDLLINGKSAMRMRVPSKPNVFDEAKQSRLAHGNLGKKYKFQGEPEKLKTVRKGQRVVYTGEQNPDDKFEGKTGTIKRRIDNRHVAVEIDGMKGLYQMHKNDLAVIKEGVNEGLITEGGAYGHMSHPFDDRGLTFGDFKNIIELSLQGRLDLESEATEKTDGQNLFITWSGSKLKAARNTGDIKKGGIDSKAIAKKFAGRGNIEKAFNYAMSDLSKAIGSLNDKQKTKVFDNGNNWVNMEIMYPASANVINYDAPYLQFHNVLKYENGSPVGSVSDGARILSGMITQVNQNVQKSFSVIGPHVLKVNPHQDFAQRKGYFHGKLNKLMSTLGMKDSNTFAEYHQAWWERFVDKTFPGIDNTIKMGLVKRWAFNDKSFRLNGKTVPDKDLLDKIKKEDKVNVVSQVKKNMLPFETLFFELGAEVLKNAEGFLAANPDKAVQAIRKQVASAIKDVRKGGDLKKLNKVKDQLAKIQSIGGFDSIVPSEGLVFIYKGNTYKLTGAFAPVNQITGLMTF